MSVDYLWIMDNMHALWQLMISIYIFVGVRSSVRLSVHPFVRNTFYMRLHAFLTGFSKIELDDTFREGSDG